MSQMPMTETPVGEMLRAVSGCHELPQLCRLGEEHHFPCLPVNSRSLLTVLADSSAGLWARPGAAALLCVFLSGCLSNEAPPPVSAIPTTSATCEALRPDMPIRYSSKGDTVETVKQVRAVNARFAAACS